MAADGASCSWCDSEGCEELDHSNNKCCVCSYRDPDDPINCIRELCSYCQNYLDQEDDPVEEIIETLKEKTSWGFKNTKEGIERVSKEIREDLGLGECDCMKKPTQIDKEELQKIVDGMKDSLQEYWVNELGLPLTIQLKSMAIMDMYIHDLELSNQSSTAKEYEKYITPSSNGKDSVYNHFIIVTPLFRALMEKHGIKCKSCKMPFIPQPYWRENYPRAPHYPTNTTCGFCVYDMGSCEHSELLENEVEESGHYD